MEFLSPGCTVTILNAMCMIYIYNLIVIFSHANKLNISFNNMLTIGVGHKLTIHFNHTI